ncbi:MULTISPECIES: MarR family winged helix-turn-helix transcriptional regulator [unclassified Curtobacterium]|jgi:DNA-binding MarR family transcriptional regulator|uniref:MarR family winged helix-turn-helix transcriptional regulator n=1 Tax=unclassified Curtobacterium TaxID=257496 RepID=UPI0008EC57EA|nr:MULTISPECIES: MarR family transcriptional regulator [unclassified Curtobacterium]MCC8909003.1 MarR family transcriptional regulator [Curtobacterium sp. GD1]MCT9622338.1 MarR family transcriptional regulator [Curtobacterium sp. C2H10]MDR6169033.1 DNA-binding MarR family transcriptional regulator [Curtobacterium sp. SORGH_AS_0776]MDR6571395.1 DNA-binding MarR family transcriptional regulator [Curtobacterium sp. 320]SFF60139.1 DNA-binding transcriptional regulator, MarR family [Curtobacterium 
MPVTDEMVCFSLYAASRATTQAYRTLLEPWGLTYPQYLVLVTLWIEGDQTVSGLGDHLQLDSGTLSPLLRRMEQSDLVRRERRSTDERVVTITLGDRGRSIRGELAHIPSTIAAGMGLPDEHAATELIATLHRLTETMHAAATPNRAAADH